MTDWDKIEGIIRRRLYALGAGDKYANLTDEARYLALDIRAEVEDK